jgi:hypothetical protein
MAKTFVSFLCTLIVCAPLPARAQSFEDIGIRAQGMAGAFVAVADDATASWWNPAGLATSVSFADLIVLADQAGGRGIAFGFPALGLSYYRLNISQIQPSASTVPGASSRQDLGATGTGLPAPGLFELDQFGATIGQSIGNHLVVASTLKLVHARSDARADLDLGAMAALGAVRLGLTVRDIASPTFGSGDGMFELARRARAGVAVIAPPHGRLDGLTFAFDADLTTAPVDGRNERHIAGGAEAWVLGRRLGVRGGLGANTLGDGGSFRAFGLSVAPFPRVYVDGAVTRGPDAAHDRWGLDLRLTF